MSILSSLSQRAVFVLLLLICGLLPQEVRSQTDSSITETGVSVDQAQLSVEIGKFKKKQGFLVVLVYDSKETWLGDDIVMERRISVAESVAYETSDTAELISLTIELPPGEYALSLYHDVNSNGKLDSNFIGIPKEPAVVSNNAPARFGPPKYRDAKFSLTEAGAEQRLTF